MKKLLLAGLLVVSAGAFASTMVDNEQVHGDIDFNLRVRQPLELTVIKGNVDFGLLGRGEEASVNAAEGTDRAEGILRGEDGANVVVTFDAVDNNNVELNPTLSVYNRALNSGETLVLAAGKDQIGYASVGFGGTVVVKDTARSGEITETVRYTFRYQ